MSGETRTRLRWNGCMANREENATTNIHGPFIASVADTICLQHTSAYLAYLITALNNTSNTMHQYHTSESHIHVGLHIACRSARVVIAYIKCMLCMHDYVYP